MARAAAKAELEKLTELLPRRSGTFQGCSQQAIDEGPEEGRAQDGPVETGEQQVGPLAADADDDDGGREQRCAGDSDAAIPTGCDLAPGGDQPGTCCRRPGLAHC